MAASLEVEDRELQRVLLESLADQQNVAHNAVDDEALARALQEQEDSLLGYASPFRASAATTYAPPSPYTAPTPAPSTLRTSSSNNRPINASATYPLAHPSFASTPTQSNSSTTLRTSSSNNRPISISSTYSAPSSTPAPTQSAPSTNTLRTSGSNNRIPSTAATYSVPSSAPAPPQSTSTSSTLRTSNSNNGSRNGSVGNPILVDEYDSGSDDEITKSVLRLSQLEQTISDMDARILSYKGVVPSSTPAPPSAQAPPPITANSPTVAAAMNAVHSATNATLTIPRTSSTNNVNSSNTATGSSNRFVAPSPPQDSADALSELLTKMSISSSNERTIRNNEKNNRSNRNHTEGVSGMPATTTTTSTTTTNNSNNNNNSTIPTNPESDPSSEAKKSARHHSSSRDKGVRTTRIGGVRVRANGGTSDSGITRRGKSSDDNRAEGDSGVRDVEMREAGDARRSTHSQKYRTSHTSTSHSSTTSTSSTLPATTTPASTAGSSTSAPPQSRISTTSTSFTSSQPITTAAPLPAIPSYSNIMGNTHTGTNSANPSRPPILYNYRPNNNPVNNTNPPNNNVNSSQHQTNVYSSNNTTTRITHNNTNSTNSVNINISYGNGGVPPLHYVHTANATVSSNDNPRAPQQENNRPNQPNTQNNRETTADEEFAQRLQLQEALEAQREFDLMGPYNQINALIGGDENVAPYYDELFGLNGLNGLNVNRQAGVPAFYLDEEGSDYSDGEGDADDVDHMTYEQLLALGERIGNVSVGASKNEIESCPKFILKQELANNKTCLVCQDDMQVGNTLRRLPCFHTYHSECIDMWLKQKPTCPVCLHTIKNE